ncbi:MAG: helix-turn-helix domain-containing protein [Niabella sp.]|nr:helix-turn-helix domain-containing protein [Niabella sp.]
MKPQLINVSLDGTKTIKIKHVEQFYLDEPFHFHQLCELVWVEKSYGKRIVGDHISNFEDADLVLMGPNLPHIWQSDEIFYSGNDHLKVKATVIYFPRDFLLNLTDEPMMIKPIEALINRANRGLCFYGKTKALVAEKLIDLSKEHDIRQIISFLEIIHILSISSDHEYLASISYKNLYDEKDTDRINKVYQYLMQHFQRDIDLKEVSDLCYMTPNAFCRYFKSRTQKPFTRFLNELRIGHASRLLQDPNHSISDVCYECGYNNLANFNKFFKSIHKMTPSEYRKKALQAKRIDKGG